MPASSEGSSRPVSALEPEIPAFADNSDESNQENGNLVKRLLVGCARKLHESPLAFRGLAKTFRTLQRIGVNVTPNHFYWPVPDLSELQRRDWPIYSPPPGCHFDLRRQAELACELTSQYGEELAFPSEPQETAYHYNNGYFEAVDADMAYCLVRRHKPERIVEIGTGYSTRVLAAAMRKNREVDGLNSQLISVDPHPERYTRNGSGDRVVQIPKAVQDVELDFFDGLESGDILFIDSSHVVATGSDVIHEYLKILPRLKPGVLVHVHDIFLPADYPREAVLNKLWFWSEQYLLQAFLSFNPAFEVLWSSSAMQMEHPWLLEQCFPRWRHSYREMPESRRCFVPTMDGERVWPSSFWMRRVSTYRSSPL